MSRPQTALLIRRAYGYGGAEIYNYNLAAELKKLGYNAIVATQQSKLTATANSAGIRVINPIWPTALTAGISWRPAKKIMYALAGGAAVLQYCYYLLRFGIDSLLIQSRDDQIFASIAARWLGRRVIWLDHGDFKYSFRLAGSTQKLYLRALRSVYRAVCVADSERAAVTKLAPLDLSDKFITIHNGVEKSQFWLQPVHFKRDQVLTIGSNARVQWQKGVDFLIEGFARALPQLPAGSRLLLMGEVDDQYIMDKVTELGLGASVEHRPYVENDQMKSFLSELSIYVFPSLMEVFPLSVLEAMMAGRVIIATNVGGIAEQIKDGESGLLVPPKSAEAIAEALIKLARDPTAAHKYAQAAQATAAENFDFSHIVQAQLVPLLFGKSHG